MSAKVAVQADVIGGEDDKALERTLENLQLQVSEESSDCPSAGRFHSACYGTIMCAA